MNSTFYLGTVDSPLRQRGTVPVVSLRTLLVASEDGNSWGRALTDTERREEFPNRGLVSWLNPDTSARPGGLWQYQIEEQPTFDPLDSHHERFKAARTSIQPVFEVIDADRFGGPERAREALTIEGVTSLSEGADYYLRLEHNLWTTVRLIRKSPGSESLVIQLHADGMLRLVEWDSPVSPIPCLVDRERLLFPPGVKPHGRQRLRDWSSDQVVFGRVLKNLRKRDRRFADTLSLSEKAIAHFSTILSNGDLSPDPGLEADRVIRAQRYIKALQDGQDASLAVEAALCDSPIADQIAARMEIMLEEEREAAKATIQAQLGKEQKDLVGVRDEISKAQKELELLRRGNAEMRASQETMVANLEQHLAERVADAVNEPVELLGQVALIRAVTNRRGSAIEPFRPTGSLVAGAQHGHEHKAIGELSDKARTLLLQRDVPTDLFKAIHSSFLAGAVPVVIGGRAHELLAAYAECVTGGSFCWIPVSAGWVEPSDYLGRLDAASGTFASHPCGLLDLLLFAQTDSRLHLVVFDGLNRAPVDSCFMPTLACHADRRSAIPRTIPVCGSYSTLSDTLKGQRGRITWPSNVLLAATIAPGSEIISLPIDLWSYSPLIITDAVPAGPGAQVFADRHPDKRKMEDSRDRSSFVSLSTWLSWQAAASEHDLGQCIQLWDQMAAKKRMPRTARDLALRYFGAAKDLADNEAALGDVLAHCLLPHFLSEPDAIPDILQVKQTIYGDGSLLQGTMNHIVDRGWQ